MNRTCARHHDLRTAVHPVARTWTTIIIGVACTISAVAGVWEVGTALAAWTGIGGVAIVGWFALRTLDAHSDGDGPQAAQIRRRLTQPPSRGVQ